jgi:hypothetical protein
VAQKLFPIIDEKSVKTTIITHPSETPLPGPKYKTPT